MKKLFVFMSIACMLLVGGLSAQTGSTEKPKETTSTSHKSKKPKKDKDAKKGEDTASKPKH